MSFWFLDFWYMRFIDQIHRIERIDQLIRLKATGQPSELAKKLGISESQLYEVLNIMKVELGGPILYSRTLQSYYYPTDIKFKCLFEENTGIKMILNQK
jgi:hypothetical protein